MTRLPIYVQAATCAAAIAGIFFTRETGYAYLAAGAVCISTIFSIALALSDDREKAFIKSSLTNLVRAVQPGEYVCDAILSRVRALASNEGLSRNQTVRTGDKFVLEFWREGVETRSGFLVVDRADLSELSLYDESALQAQAAVKLLQHWGSDDLERDWNQIVEKFKGIANAVFAMQLQRPFALKIWVRNDIKYIGIGPPDCSANLQPGFRAEFPEHRLRDLLSKPPLYRGAVIANACERLLKPRDNV